MAQLHKKFTNSQVKELMERYLKKEIKRSYLQEILGIKRRRFCLLAKKYRKNPDSFSIQYHREKKARTIPMATEKNILKELKIEQNLIKDKDVPLKSYNYSFIMDVPLQRNNQNCPPAGWTRVSILACPVARRALRGFNGCSSST